MKLADMVYEKLREVPKGKVTTYKLLAQAVGTKAYRAIGSILSRNPYAPEVPCHRVVASDGKIGGFMGRKEGKDIEKKLKMLREEGVVFEKEKVKDFGEKIYKF